MYDRPINGRTLETELNVWSFEAIVLEVYKVSKSVFQIFIDWEQKPENGFKLL